MSVSAHKKTFTYGDQKVTLETGQIARQADAAVMVSMGDTVVLATAVVEKQAKEARDFLPLTVVYQEKSYAAGRIPGGYFKREGRPPEQSILNARLIDRPIRPLFPESFTNEIQVVVTVMSLDPEINPDIPSLIAASAALHLSGVPFAGPIGAAKVGYKDGVFILNPKASELEQSKLELVVAGTQSAVLMVESEAAELPEDVMLNAVLFGHEQMQTVIDAINALGESAGRKTFAWEAPVVNSALLQQVKAEAETALIEGYKIQEKAARKSHIDATRDRILQKYLTEGADKAKELELKSIVKSFESDIVRNRILAGELRIDGRNTTAIRSINVDVGVLPRTHGSALFTRGETQAIVVTTLGTARDAQIIDALEGEKEENFMLHYNFPPYCVGEIGMMGSPKRREIGHGNLAKRAIKAVLPSQESFPYVLRVVSEITESNGSSSMASVCGTSLALMDAGVPIKAPVAGIAMGLIKEGTRFAVLSDILGDEDHLGDMDFKVAGTENGVTALQMDIKIDGITSEIMHKALEQAREGRMHILNVMGQTISAHRSRVSDYAPRIISMKVARDKIRDVIGKGGVTIRAITEETGATVDINDDGEVKIFAVDEAAGEAARKRIEDLTSEVQVGVIYEGKVARIMDFGAFVTLKPGTDGLVHVSQIANERVDDVNKFLSEGQMVKVKVLDIDRQGRIKLSMKEVTETETETEKTP